MKESSQRYLKLLRLSIVSFVCMGVLIGYHGAPLINSLIGMFWFVFAMTAGMVVISALTQKKPYRTAKLEANRNAKDSNTNVAFAHPPVG